MAYKAGETVIVTTDDTHQVGVVLDKYLVNKQTMYDVLLENRSALIMLNTSAAKHKFINKTLTSKLCNAGLIETTIPYKELLEQDKLPICRD